MIKFETNLKIVVIFIFYYLHNYNLQQYFIYKHNDQILIIVLITINIYYQNVFCGIYKSNTIIKLFIFFV